MEKEIRSETEMEEGTGGWRKGRKKEEGNKERDLAKTKRKQVNACLFLPVGHLFPFTKFSTAAGTSLQGRSQQSTSFRRPESQSLHGN